MRGKPELFANLVGGLNTNDAPYSLKDTESRDLLNMVGTTRGAIRKRKGSVTFSTPAVALTSVATLQGTSDFLVGAGSTKLYKITSGGTSSDLKTGLTNGARWDFKQMPASGGQGPIYGMNGIDTPQQWDGAAGTSSNWTAASGTLPNGKYMVFHQGRLFVAGVTSAPSDVFFSDVQDPRAWPVANVVRFDGGDGEGITGLGVCGSYILVFKDSKTWVIYNPDTGANRKISDSIGCLSHRSIVQVDETSALFLGTDGIYSTNGSSLQRISDRIKPTIDAIPAASRQNTAGVYFDHHYYLSFASSGGNNDRTLDYDLNLKSWWLHSLAANQFVVFDPGAQPDLYGARPDQAIVSRWNASGTYQDSGVSYLAKWFGPHHIFGAPFLRKRVRQIHFDGIGLVDLYVGKDFAGAPTFVTTVDLSTQTTNFGDGTFGGDGIFGAGPGIQENRVFSLGVARAWSICFQNLSSREMEIDSYTTVLTPRRN